MKKILTTILAMALGASSWGATVSTEAELRTAIAAGGDVTLGADIALTSTLEISKSVTLDLNGKTLSKPLASTSDKAHVIKALSGTVVIKNGSIVHDLSTYTGTSGNEYANVIFVGGYNSYGSYINGDCALTLLGVDIIATFPTGNKQYSTIHVESGTLEINGCNLSATGGNASANKYVIYIITHNQAAVPAEVTLSGETTIDTHDGAKFYAIWVQKEADKLNIGKDVIINATGAYAVYRQYGTTAIAGGKFSGRVWQGTSTSTIIVSGGYFSYEMGTLTTKLQNKMTLAEGVEYLENMDPETKDAYPYVVSVPKTYVAQIGETKYETLAAAFAAVEDGATVTLLADVTDDTLGAKGIVIDGSNTITLDLAGHGITCTDGSAANNRMIKLAGTTTLNVVNSGETVGVMDVLGANTAVADKSTSTTLPYGVFRAEAGTTLNVTAANGNIKLVNGRAWGLNVKLCGATATLTGVTIESRYGGGIEVTEADLGTGSVTGSATLTGCTFTQTGYFDHCSTTLSVSGGSALTVNGGTYSGEQALYVFSSGGVITVEDGTFTGNGGRAAFVAAIDTQTYPSYTGGMTLKDGKFSGSFNITSPAYVSATGGLYSADPSAYVAAGCAAVDNADETTKEAYPYAVGKVTAGELTEQSGATETAATYTVPVAVTDGNGDTLSSLGDALTVSVSVAEGDIADTTLSDIKVDSVVGSAVAAAGGTADSIAVEIAVSTNDMVVGESSVSYEVKPEAVVTVTKDEATTTTTNELTNADLASGASFTFDLDVTATGVAAGGWVKVTHVSSDYPDETSLCKAKAGANGAIVVTVTTSHFSTFTATPADTSGADAALLPSVTNTIVSANCFGAVAITGSAAATAFVAVPFGAFVASDAPIAARDVVQAASLSEDDRMYVWTGAAEGGEQRYEVYKVSGGAWVADGNKVTVASNGTVRVGSESPDAVAVPTGTGVFIERQDASKPIYVYGQVLPAPASGQISFGSGLTLVSPPSTLALSDIDLNKLEWDGVSELDASCVKKFGAVYKAVKTTAGADYIYYRNQANDVIQLYRYNGRWGTRNNLAREDAGVIPAGTAFWFANKSGAAKVTWTAAE